MATKILNINETPLVWKDSGGDYAMTLINLATVTGRQGAQHDFGALLARSRMYAWRAYISGMETAGVVGETIEIYAKTSDEAGVADDNDDGDGDIALSNLNKVKNCKLLGVMQLDEAAIDINTSVGGLIELPERFFAPIIYNATADNLQNSGGAHGFILTPWVPQSQ